MPLFLVSEIKEAGLLYLMSDRQYDKVENVILGGGLAVELSQEEYNELVEKKRKKQEFEKLMARVVENNNLGIELEKEGKVEEAIGVYEENVQLDFQASHSYQRLCILYRKQKNIEAEERIVNLALAKLKKNQSDWFLKRKQWIMSKRG